MSKQIVVHNIDEQDKYKNTILDNLNNSVNMLQQVLRNSDALNAFKFSSLRKWQRNRFLATRKILLK